MAKIFAVTIIMIAIGSAIPIVMHTWDMPQDISTHGHLIDEHIRHHGWRPAFRSWPLNSCWRSSSGSSPTRSRRKDQEFSRRRDGIGDRGFPVGRYGGLGAGRVWSQSMGECVFHSAAANAMPIQVQAGQFAFYFRYPGPDGKFGPMHPDQISEANANFFGLDTDSRSGFQRRHRHR